MSRGYIYTHAPITDAVGGDPTTGTLWDNTYETNQDALLNAVLANVDADMSYCFATLGADTPDNVTFQYKNTTTVTVSAGIAGGWAIANATDVDFTGATSSTRYYLWIGEDSVTGLTALKKGTSHSAAPAGLVADTAYRLRWYVDINGSGYVTPFWFAFGDDLNDVTYNYTDADTITFTAGTKFTDPTGALHRLEAAATLKLSNGRSADAGAEAANTLYYIWGGLKVSDGTLGFYFHTSATLLPSELSTGRLIRGAVRNDNSSNIVPFQILGNRYDYRCPIDFGGSDITELFDGTAPTSGQALSAAGWAPSNALVLYGILNATQLTGASTPGFYLSLDNSTFQRIPVGDQSSATNGFIIGTAWYPVVCYWKAAHAYPNTRIAVLAYLL